MTPDEHVKHLLKTSKEVQSLFNSELPTIVGVEGVNFFTESFQNEGFTDEVLEPWPDVKRRTNPTRPDRAAATRKILTGETGDLGRSIDFTPSPGEVAIKSDKEYAAAHNEGTTTAGRNHNVTIPKRQFIGESKAFDKIVKDITEDRLKRAQGI